MLTALLLIAIFFGLVQEVKLTGRFRGAGLRSRKQVKRSALVAVPEKPKSR
jgi:hypothetical protein